MPVWHEATRAARDAGRLRVVGITQEQHPERCVLFARWKRLDFPILWDPLNLTGSKVVPNFTLVDAHGLVRIRRARLEELDDFLGTRFEAPAAAELPDARPRSSVLRVLENRSADPTPLVEAWGRGATDPGTHFRRGVALRMRVDRGHGHPGDFAAAVRAWRRALAAVPSQYIWRRRLQQYGPLQDKPYPFYRWIREARAELTRRGEPIEALRAPLTLSERSLGVEAGGARPIAVSPDPKRGLPVDDEDLLAVETALVFDTGEGARVARLHIEVRPRHPARATWNGGADPLVTWIETGAGVRVEPPGLQVLLPPSARDGVRTFEHDVVLSEEAGADAVLRLVVFAPVCRGDDGTCLYLRHEHEVPLAR